MKIKLGMSPISWTNDDLPELGGETTFETCLSEPLEAGFIGTELGGKFPKNNNELNTFKIKKIEYRNGRCWLTPQPIRRYTKTKSFVSNIIGSDNYLSTFVSFIPLCFFLYVLNFLGYDLLSLILSYAPGGQAEMCILTLSIGGDIVFVSIHHVFRVFFVIFLATILKKYLLKI